MKLDSIGGVAITRESPFFIAEAGVNHEGDLTIAMEMVEAAAGAGADAVKFQSYKADTLASKNSPAYWNRSKEVTNNQHTLFSKYDRFGEKEYRLLAKQCEKAGILFMSTPFDLRFVDIISPLVPAIKISSADITNVPLLRHVAAKGKPIILSTGASFLAEIEQALRVCRAIGNEYVAVLHCTLEYPASAQNANLSAIGHLAQTFPDTTIGWSDHIPPEQEGLSLLTAWFAGADILEKHFTLNKTLPGNDHYHAFDPDDLRAFIARQRYAAKLLGIARKQVLASEEVPRRYARRSIVAHCDIPAGERITSDMLIAKRPGNGISPEHWDLIVGARSRVDITADTVLTWDMFLK